MKTLVLFSREGCHLCDLVLDALLPVIEGRATLRIVDIDEDPALMESYGMRVPVLACDELELSGYPLDMERVERFLAACNG